MRTPFEAKRVIVAASAAIAMVMGAMSVSSSVSTSGATDAKGHISSIVTTSETPKSASQPVNTTNLSSKHTLEVRDFLQQQSAPLYNTPTRAIKTTQPKDALSQTFAQVNPVFFMTQMVQLQQPAQPVTADGQPVTSASTSSSTAPDTSSTDKDTTKTPSSDSTGSSKDSNSTPPSDSSQPQSQSFSSTPSPDPDPTPTP